MALQDKNGHYYKFESISLRNNSIQYSKWENQAHRLAGETEFHNAEYYNVDLPDLATAMQGQVDKTLSLANNLKKLAYLQWKLNNDFKDFTDIL